MRIGILGYPGSGKTTLFNLISGAALPLGQSSKSDAHTAAVEIPDPRLDALQELLQPPKVTYSKMTIVDAGGFQEMKGRSGLAPALLNQLATMQGLVHVVRDFHNPNMPHIAGSVNPQRDIADMESDFLLHDVDIVEHRLQRLEEERGKGAGNPADIEREQLLLQRLLESLEDETPLRMLSLSADDERVLSGFGLMSQKPLLVVLSADEQSNAASLKEIPGVETLILQAELELDISALAPEEAAIFLKEYAIEKPGRERFLQATRELLCLISFFTFNDKELRAWALQNGSSALDAAGVIHSDIARGFIRAEVIGWNDLVELGGMSAARKVGKLRVEGKNYQIMDGELITIRFNV